MKPSSRFKVGLKSIGLKAAAALLMVSPGLASVAPALALEPEIRFAGSWGVENGRWDDVCYHDGGSVCYSKDAILAEANRLMEVTCETPARQMNARISRFLAQEGLESENEAFVAYVNKDVKTPVLKPGCWQNETARYGYLDFRCEALVRNTSARIEILRTETPVTPRKDSAGNDLCARLLKQTVSSPDVIKAEIVLKGGGVLGPGNTCRVSYLKAVKI